MAAMAWWTLFSIMLSWHVSCQLCFLVHRYQTAAANSGNSIFLLGILVFCWSLDWCLLLVTMAGGAASTALGVVFDRVLVDGDL